MIELGLSFCHSELYQLLFSLQHKVSEWWQGSTPSLLLSDKVLSAQISVKTDYLTTSISMHCNWDKNIDSGSKFRSNN